MRAHLRATHGENQLANSLLYTYENWPGSLGQVTDLPASTREQLFGDANPIVPPIVPQEHMPRHRFNYQPNPRRAHPRVVAPAADDRLIDPDIIRAS